MHSELFFYLQPGQHARELNPYWKEGGCGLPQNKSTVKSAAAVSVAGDGGLTWVRKAVDRCLEQARETGQSVEEIAADRYGVRVKS